MSFLRKKGVLVTPMYVQMNMKLFLVTERAMQKACA